MGLHFEEIWKDECLIKIASFFFYVAVFKVCLEGLKECVDF